RSCGNRHCPNCQKNKTSDWLAKQTDRLLPVHHFLVTFTVPEELRSLLRSNQREGYTRDLCLWQRTIRDVGLGDPVAEGL
ncbi:transposase zinc-binding domain-containing protein, partial [Rubripirellula obstinata]|uniref:transposase zinc-binding domain-containing protein n=1 Tax=Rubripirellula obstinata TaxID=406547 RepID=UPI00190F2D05